MAGITPSQTIGPFSASSLTPDEPGKAYRWRQLAKSSTIEPDTIGECIRIEGRVTNGAGQPLLLTLLEFWQADAQGYYAHPADNRRNAESRFRGFARAETNGEGYYAIETIKPGSVLAKNGELQAPHIVVAIYSPYLLDRLCTRIYFDGDERNHLDPILRLVPSDRRDTLIARRDGQNYRIDFFTQGDQETVFFDF